jgi:hypothetical protein
VSQPEAERPATLKLRQLPEEAEAMLAGFAATAPPEEASRLLANAANRAIAMLHKLARDQAAARKGGRDWATWAKLASASRNAVLAASMTREVANDIAAQAAREDA